MKKISVFPLLLLLFACTARAGDEPEREKRQPGAFTSVKVYGRFEVTLVKGTEESVSLESQKTKLENVLTEVDGSKLKVRMKINYFQNPNVKVIITYRELTEVQSGAGAIIQAGPLEGNTLTLKAATGSELTAQVNAQRLVAEVVQGSSMNLLGEVKDMEASVGTGGQLNAFALVTDNTRVKVTMGGYAKLTVHGKLDAGINMGGNISFKGAPKEVKQSSTMGGTITEIRD